MYKEHPVFEKPADENARIWRYLDFSKFVSMLEKKALFFVRADKLGDLFEGSYSRANLEIRRRVYDKMPVPAIKQLSDIYEKHRRFTLLNCWSISDCENEALWKLYLKSDRGVAIRSTFRRLADSLREGTGNVYIGKVKYVDYATELIPEGNTFYPFLYKRKSFAYESELRAVIQRVVTKPGSQEVDWETEICETGIYVPADLSVLVERIFVSPSESWFNELVKTIVAKYNLNKEVLTSTLADKPVY